MVLPVRPRCPFQDEEKGKRTGGPFPPIRGESPVRGSRSRGRLEYPRWQGKGRVQRASLRMEIGDLSYNKVIEKLRFKQRKKGKGALSPDPASKECRRSETVRKTIA